MGYVTYHNVKTIQIFSPAITIGYRNIDRRALYEKTTHLMTVEVLLPYYVCICKPEEEVLAAMFRLYP